jgi:hypothetical protein
VTGLVVVGVVGAVGGLARTSTDDLRVVAPGEETVAAPFRVRLDRAEATYEVAGDVADEGLAYVVVEGSLTLEAEESVLSDVVGEAFAADLRSTYTTFGAPEREGAPTSVVVATDDTELSGLGPDLTYDVLLVWVIDEAAVPSTMDVRLREHTWRTGFIDKEEGWFDPAPVASVSFDVAPLPDERPVEDTL